MGVQDWIAISIGVAAAILVARMMRRAMNATGCHCSRKPGRVDSSSESKAPRGPVFRPLVTLGREESPPPSKSPSPR